MTAAAAMVPRLRYALLTCLAAIAVTRITFGAHFPLDVLAGTVLGYEFGLLSVALAANARLLPASAARALHHRPPRCGQRRRLRDRAGNGRRPQ